MRGTHLAFIVGLFAALVPGRGVAQEAPPTYLALRELKIALEQAIREAKRVSSDPPHFIIKKIELELQGNLTAGAEGSIGIPVFGVGVDLAAKGNYESEQKLKIELVPPESQVVGGVPTIELAPLIRALKDTFRGGTGGIIPSEIQFSYKWTLQLDGGGKINVVVAKAEVKVAQERSQQVTFHLCHTINRSECTR